MPNLRLVPGPGESLQANLLEPQAIVIHLDAPVSDSEKCSFQLWTDLPSLAAWLAPRDRGGEGEAHAPASTWHGETATGASDTEFRIATIPLSLGAMWELQRFPIARSGSREQQDNSDLFQSRRGVGPGSRKRTTRFFT